MTFYLILFFVLLAGVAFVLLISPGEGGRYAEKEYRKKKNNPFDSFMI